MLLVDNHTYTEAFIVLEPGDKKKNKPAKLGLACIHCGQQRKAKHHIWERKKKKI